MIGPLMLAAALAQTTGPIPPVSQRLAEAFLPSTMSATFQAQCPRGQLVVQVITTDATPPKIVVSGDEVHSSAGDLLTQALHEMQVFRHAEIRCETTGGYEIIVNGLARPRPLLPPKTIVRRAFVTAARVQIN